MAKKTPPKRPNPESGWQAPHRLTDDEWKRLLRPLHVESGRRYPRPWSAPWAAPLRTRVEAALGTFDWWQSEVDDAPRPVHVAAALAPLVDAAEAFRKAAEGLHADVVACLMDAGLDPAELRQVVEAVTLVEGLAARVHKEEAVKPSRGAPTREAVRQVVPLLAVALAEVWPEARRQGDDEDWQSRALGFIDGAIALAGGPRVDRRAALTALQTARQQALALPCSDERSRRLEELEAAIESERAVTLRGIPPESTD